MIDRDWLEDAIDERANDKFADKFEFLPQKLNRDNGTRTAWQALKNTQEFKKFKSAAIPVLKEQITQSILGSLSSVQELLKRGDQ